MRSRALSASSSDTSRPTVSTPASTHSCAMPAPIAPRPTTPTFTRESLPPSSAMSAELIPISDIAPVSPMPRARKPIAGPLTTAPVYPDVAIAAMPAPDETPGTEPPTRSSAGTIAAQPAPTSPKPASAGTGDRRRERECDPERGQRSAVPRKSRDPPAQEQAIAREPGEGHRDRVDDDRTGGDGGARTDRPGEKDRAPVHRRRLDEHRAERQERGQRERTARQREVGGVDVGRRTGQKPRHVDRDEHERGSRRRPGTAREARSPPPPRRPRSRTRRAARSSTSRAARRGSAARCAPRVQCRVRSPRRRRFPNRLRARRPQARALRTRGRTPHP